MENQQMAEETIIPVKYIFLDVVGFTHNRSVDTQAEIVGSLNEIVRISVDKISIPAENIIFIPTGDGICICLLNIDYLKAIGTTYDAHLRIALNILEELEKYNNSAKDAQHKFQIRIGINENIDNVVIDINGNRNVAGDGINMSQRVMNIADGNQILISQTVFSTVSVREQYFHESFKKLPTTTIKHGKELSVYQFIASNHIGLNINIPERYKTKEREQSKLTKLAAYYFAHAIKNEKFFIELNDTDSVDIEGTVLLYFLAEDSVELSTSGSIDNFSPHTGNWGSNIQEQYEYIRKIDFWLLMKLQPFLLGKYLSDYYGFFESDRFGMRRSAFINLQGKEKLKEEWKEIWDEFSLSENLVQIIARFKKLV